jgi:hypothetical protein
VLHLGHSTENITELYGADPADVREALGRNWIDVSGEEARTVLGRFVGLMQRLQASDPPTAATPATLPPEA